MIVYIDDSDSHDFKTSLVFSCTTWPEISQPRDFLSGLGYIGRIYGNCLSCTMQVLFDKLLIKWKPVKWVFLEIVSIGLLREFSISSQLKKVYPVGDGHKQFHYIHEDFFKWFVYICYWFESLLALGLVLHKKRFFSHNQKGLYTSNLLIIIELCNTFLV